MVENPIPPKRRGVAKSNTPARRAIFLSGLIGAVVLVLIPAMLR
jgi:hypothetical protein